MSPETLAQQHHHYHRLRVVRIIEETADAKSFVLEIPEQLKGVFEYRAGQHLTLKIPYEGKELLRCYSLASSPDCESEHKVTVKRIAEGRISNWMNDELAEGDEVLVLPPTGRFVLRDAGNDLLFFSGGSGITPVISLIKSALVTNERRMKLFYANRDERSIIFREELDELARRHPDRLEIVHSLDEREGFLTPERARREIAGHEDADFYVCGPTAFMGVLEEALEGLGAPPSRVFIERFVSLDDPEAHRSEDPLRAAETDAGSALCATVRVTLEGEIREIPYTPGKTLLETARAAGLQPPSSCEDAYCSCCMAKLVEGEVRMRKNDCLVDHDLEAGWVLTCQSLPQTRIVHVDWDES